MSTLPPIDAATLPADVRAGSTEDKTNYQAALQFERQLVEQLTQTMANTTGSESSDEDGSSSAATQQYKQMLPGVIADAVMGSGGLGLARTIAANLKSTGATS